jgi:hypothetical protein
VMQLRFSRFRIDVGLQLRSGSVTQKNPRICAVSTKRRADLNLENLAIPLQTAEVGLRMP